MTEPKKAPGGRGSREWHPYAETTQPPSGARAEGRDMEFVELLAVMSAIRFFACRARLKPSEQDVLNAVLHHTVRYGRTVLLSSHGYLAKYTGYAPKTHGLPLKGLHEKGFIVYQQGSPKKDSSGHRHTQSQIRVIIPEGWEAFKDNSWVGRFANEGETDPFENGSSSSKDAGEGHLNEGLETQDLHAVDSEGLETRDPKVSNLQTQRSRNSRPDGLESPDLQGLEIGGTKRGVVNRGVLKREVLNGKTLTDPPSAEQKLGAADAEQSHASMTAKTSPPATSRPKGPEAPSSGSPLVLLNPRNPELNAETSAVAALGSLERHVKDAGRRRLTTERRDEIVTACTRLIETDPEIEDQDLHYLLGLWAGDRELGNANHLGEHMRRNKKYLSKFTRDMEANGRGEEPVPDEWLKAGIVHGQQKRKRRIAEDQEKVASNK